MGTTRRYLTLAIGLASACGGPDWAKDEPEVSAEALTSPSQTIEHSDCVAGTITLCPGSSTLLKSCTLASSGGEYSYLGVNAFRAPSFRSGDSWAYTYCRGGTTVELSCEPSIGAVNRQTLQRCEYQAAISGVVGKRLNVGQIATSPIGLPIDINGVNGSTTPVLYHDNMMVASLVRANPSTEVTRQGVSVALAHATYLSLDPEGFLLEGTIATGATFRQGGLDVSCGASEIVVHPTGFVESCAGSLTTILGASVMLVSGWPSFDANGFLVPSMSRLWVQSDFLTRRHGTVTCAANSNLSFDAAGYLKACTLPAGTTKKFLVNQPNQPKVPATAANVDVECKQGFVLDDNGYLASCTLNANRSLRAPPIAGVQQAAIACAASTPVNLYTNGYLNRCSPVANTTVRTGATPNVNLVCAAASPIWFNGNGHLSSCRLTANFTGTLPAMGSKPAAALTCAANNEAGFYTDGLISRCFPTAHTLVRLGDTPLKQLWCKSNAELKLSSTKRVSSCTLAYRTATDGYAASSTDRMCPANTFVTFTNLTGPVRDQFGTVRAAGATTTFGINAAGTPCLFDVGASCSSNAQCDTGLCAAGKCAPISAGASCIGATGCSCTDDAECASGSCAEGLCG